MSHPRWSEIRVILDEALELPEAQRMTRGLELCGDDPELRAEVRRLIELGLDESASDSGGVLEGSALQALFPHWPRGDEPIVVDGFELVREVGAGGMGMVFEAIELESRRRVALKVMSPGIHSPASRQRFQQEFRLVARLKHPAIAQAYTSGVIADGTALAQPWFSMEYVEDARTIEQWVDGARPDRPTLLETFARVCDAVHCGHERGVLHRDLKPANVLVDGLGAPKVIDFGVGRIIDDESSIALELTQTGHVVGTLRFMSPEQVSGSTQDLTVRSDVYSLGVVLYRLLCGALPYGELPPGFAEIALAIQMREPVRPSRHDPELAGDLEWILLRALEKDPAWRYASARELGEDLRRHLEHRPVLASPPSSVYRLRKFARRHRGAVLSTAALLVCGATALVLTSRSYRGSQAARRAQQEAEERRDSTRETLTMAFDLLNDNTVHSSAEVLDLLDEVRRDLDEAFGEDRLAQSELRAQLSGLFWDLGLHEESLAESLGALEILEGLESADVVPMVRALHGASKNLETLGRIAESLEALERALELSADDELLDAQTKVALGKILLKDPTTVHDSVPLLEGALGVMERILGSRHADVLAARGALASALFNTGETEDGLALLAQAKQVAERELGILDAVVGSLWYVEADLQVKLGNPHISAEILGEYNGILARQLPDERHPRRLEVGSAWGNYLRLAGETERAETILRGVVEGLEERFAPSHIETLKARCILAATLHGLGRYEESEALYLGSISTLQEVHGPHNETAITSLVCLGDLYLDTGRVEDAFEHKEQALLLREESLGARHRDSIATRARLGNLYLDLDRVDEALRHKEQVVTLRAQSLGVLDPDTIATREGLGRLYLSLGGVKQGRASMDMALVDKGLEHLERVLAQRLESQGQDHRETVATQCHLVRSYGSLGRVARGLEIALAAAAAVPTEPTLEPIEVADAKLLLGICLMGGGRSEEARESLEAALEIALEQAGEDHKIAMTAVKCLGRLPPGDN